MTVGQTAYMEVEWVEMAYNLDESQDDSYDSKRKVKRSSGGNKCKRICEIDGVKVVGRPEAAGAGRRGVEWWTLVFVGVVAVWVF